MADDYLESLARPRKPTDSVCRLCSENFKPSKTNKHRLFRGIDCLDKAEFTVVLERFIGKLQETSSAICTSCRRVLTKYDSVSKEVTRLKSQIDDMYHKTREIRGETRGLNEPSDLPPDDANTASSPAVLNALSSDTAVLNQTRRVRKPYRTLMNNIYRRRYRVLAKNLMKIPGQSQLIIDEVLKKVEKECRFLISKRFQAESLQQPSAPSNLTEFKCEKVLDEWKTAAPTFLRFLKSASAAASFIKHRTKGAKPDEGESWSRKKPEVTMAGLILLKSRSKLRLCKRYRRNGGAKRRRMDRFNRAGGTPSATLKKMKEIAETWDDGFLEWKKVCECPCLDDLSWMDESSTYSSYFYSDHTYNCQEGQVETVIVDTSGDENEECSTNLQSDSQTEQDPVEVEEEQLLDAMTVVLE